MNHLRMSEYFAALMDTHKANSELDILKRLSSHYGFDHITYLVAGIPTNGPQTPKVITTYSEEWAHEYKVQDYKSVDPVLRVGFNSLLPLDWSKVYECDRSTRKFFDAAKEHGISRNGLTVPIRGIFGERGLLSINVDTSLREWSNLSPAILPDLIYCSYLFHQFVLDKNLPEFLKVPIDLSPREREVLKWASDGKSAWETGMILGLTEQTVKFYLKNIYAKLRVTNKVQAVAKSIRLGLMY